MYKQKKSNISIEKMLSSTHSLIDTSETAEERKKMIRNRAHSVEPKYRRHQERNRSQPSEVKIQNTDSRYSVLENYCDSLELLLNDIDLNKSKVAVEKLLKVQKLIQAKISNIRKGNLGVESSDLCDSVALPEDVVSAEDIQCLDELFQEFLTAIICPFCLKRQESKISFIEHLDKDCSAHLEKKVKSSEPFPFAEFQILPNSSFKCNICHNSEIKNLEGFHKHMQNILHERAYVKAAAVKNYTRCLFCSVCKVLVPSTYTQIDSHIKHEIHEKRALRKKSTAFFLNNGYCCLFNDSKKFKCLICLNLKVALDTPASMLEHMQSERHRLLVGTKQRMLNARKMYCEVCSRGINVYEILIHFASSSHNIQERTLTKSFELCFYCGSSCDTLTDLLFHMKSKCDEINCIRQKNIKTDKSKPEESQETIEKADLLEDNVKGSSIMVKDYAQIPKLYKYFKEFGDISAVELCNDKDVVLQFSKKSVVDDILLVRDLIKIDGVKLEIEVVENISVSNEKHQEGNKGDENSGETTEGDENSHEISDESDDEDQDEEVIENDELEGLFQGACHYLKNTAERDAEEKTKIIDDCVSTMGVKSCNATGFSGCGLSFPSESLNLCCYPEANPLLESSTTSEMLWKSVMRRAEKSFLHSDLWSDVHVEEKLYASIKCVHKASKKACTILFSKSTVLLTDMLRECMEQNKLVQPFCLAIRLWLSVHELLKVDCEYATISLLVFFLIHKEIVKLPSRFVPPEFCRGINGVEFSSDVEGDSLPKLFHGFLRFLNEFDFDKYAICLPFKYPVPKTCFTTPAFKEESGIKNPASLISCAMCFLDPILFVNLGFEIKQKHKQNLLDTVKLSIKSYKIL